jgi:hypothetical protein
MKIKVVVSVRRERREEGLGRRSRCFGHGGDARDGFVGFYTAKRATDGLVFQILNSRNCVGLASFPYLMSHCCSLTSCDEYRAPIGCVGERISTCVLFCLDQYAFP